MNYETMNLWLYQSTKLKIIYLSILKILNLKCRSLGKSLKIINLSRNSGILQLFLSFYKILNIMQHKFNAI